MKTKTALWNNIQEELKDNIFNPDILTKFINHFYETRIKNLNSDQHILFLFRIELINSDIKTTTKLLKLDNNLENKDNLIAFLLEKINLTSESYNDTPIKSLIISYGIRKGKIIPTIKPIALTEKKNEGNKYQHIYYNHKLPIALNALDYGTLIGVFGDTTIVSFKKHYNLTIQSEDNKNHIKFFKNGVMIYEWTDHIKEDNSLMREIGKTTFLWKEGEILWTKVLKTTKPIKKKRISSGLKENFITMDLETISKIDPSRAGSTLIPYLLCWYDGKRDKTHSYFIDPSLGDTSIKDIIYRAMTDICTRKYKCYKIYLHNFSKFDAIFLVKYLILIGECDPVIHKGKIISFSFKPNWKKDFGKVTFLDSYLLLTSSLSKLSKSFNIDSPKTLFPIHLNNINYQGSVPDIKYFKDISLEDYEKYKASHSDKIWNFKTEAIAYCSIDCKALYQILSRFNKLIFEKFRLNITDHPTLPSLAFSIYRSSFYKNEVIHQLSGKIDKDIRQGYTGGSTEMFIPKPPQGKKIYAYDINSLYPSVMRDNDIPIGSPIYFEGNILKQDSKAFGFFYCKITAPEGLLHPILQLHHKTFNGLRTISPLGSWEGMYFSEELYNAEKFGYKFKILRGYTFDRGNIFKDYIDNLYNLRLNYTKSDPLNFTAKILLNSLYGRFGMNDDFNILEIVDQEELIEIESSYLIIDNIQQLSSTKGKEKYLVSYSNPESKTLTLMDGNKETHNINISVAAAITAYARIHMSQFKNNPSFPNLYYSDTDSLYFDGPIPDSFISPTILGKLKLEGIYNSAVFLAPKVYALQNQDGLIVKIKGLSKYSIVKNKINIELLYQLLHQNGNIKKNQDKWFRSLSEGTINILNQTYNLKVTGNKRELIYNSRFARCFSWNQIFNFISNFLV